jgi:hypothetical protein
LAQERCRETKPELVAIGDHGESRCVRAVELRGTLLMSGTTPLTADTEEAAL